MQYERAFSYQFEDQQWPTKLGLAALISLVPILSLALVGYSVGIIRNVAASAAEPLPHWEDLGGKFMDGLLVTLALLVYSIPMFIALAIPGGILLTSGALASSARTQDLGRVLGGAGWVVLAGMVAFLIIYSLLLSLIRPAVLVIFSREGTFASCFRLRKIFDIITRHASLYFTTWLVFILGSFGIGMVLGFANLVIGLVPCLGWIASLVLSFGSAIYIVTIEANLFGQFRRIALQGSSPASPMQGSQSQQNPGDLSS